MTVACPDCRSVFRVDPAKVPATGVRARCSVCGGVIAIAAGTLPVAVTPGSSTAVHQAAPAPIPVPARPVNAQPSPTHVTPRTTFPHSVTPQSATPQSATPQSATPQRPFTPTVPRSTVPAAPGPSSSSAATPGAAPGAPEATPGASIAQGVSPRSVQATPASGKRPINPFLNADPGQRARRLARALVSDLVAYHPQKREEGLRDGTLRQLFREEIKKSYEEYVEQVGRELADSTPHFQDALNEILGSGRKLF